MYDVRSLHLDHRDDREVTVITVDGEVDVLNAPRLRELLIELINTGHLHFVVDVEKVTFLDSTALGVLIGAWRRVRDHGGCLALAGAPKQIRQIFHVTCLTRNFALYNTTSEAIQACHAGRVGTPSPAGRLPQPPASSIGGATLR
ncbi:MAG: anti-sigma-factor antagonist [Actinomycetia bacterium]|nr:anti-sigma-factor antagonist [Actinomycetes bacterium]